MLVSKILKNNTASPVSISDVGQVVPASGQLTIQPTDYWLYAASDDVITFIGDSTLTVNDGTSDLTINNGAKLIQEIFPNPVGVAAGDDGTPIGHVGDSLKVTATAAASTFDTSGGTTIGTTETALVIPIGTRQFTLGTLGEDASVLTVANAVNGTNSDTSSYRVHPGTRFSGSLDGSSALTVYIKSSKANTIVQVLSWS